jgi:hypothetical protein
MIHRAQELAKISLHFQPSFYMQVTHYKMTECFSVGPS